MKQKKPTKGELEKRMHNAIVLVPKDKDTKSIYFDDKCLRVTVTSDYAVISTLFHQHVFNAITASGVSKPYMYTQMFVEIALEFEEEIMVKDSQGNKIRSYAMLLKVLKEKDSTKYNMCWFYDIWLFNIFTPLYEIGESEKDAFIVYEGYLHNIARNQVILSEKKNGITNKQFLDETIDLIKKYTEDIKEVQIFEPRTDEQQINALMEQQENKIITEQANGQ